MVVDIEQLAVSAVVSIVGRCPRLLGEISSNDKTPVTDGHIDLYETARHSKADILGRVILQVKGRSTSNPVNLARDTIKFGVDRDDLEFFRTHGGGLYFYVPMRPDGDGAEVFYAILNPFKIQRLTGKKATAVSVSVPFRRLPTEPAAVEGIVNLALKQRPQSFVQGRPEQLLQTAQNFTIHTLSGIDHSRPTAFDLDTMDYAVVVTTPDGIDVPIDLDMQFFPADYAPHPLNVQVRCGEFTYDNPIGRRVSGTEFLLTCSAGLTVRLFDRGEETGSKVDLQLAGTARQRLHDVNFFLALANGSPIVVDDMQSSSRTQPLPDADELSAIQRALTGVVALFDYFALPDEVIAALQFSPSEFRDLFRLYHGLVRGEEIAAEANGSGRWDFPVGAAKIILLVSPGSERGKHAISDPFDPEQRSRMRMFRSADDEAVEEITWATVYESLEVDDFNTALNLHLDKIVTAYDTLADTTVRYKLASDTLLNMIRAADQCAPERRAYLLDAAADLNDWLLRTAEDDIVHRINRWQILDRQGRFSADERRDLIVARRARRSGDDEPAIDACFAILLDEEVERDLIVGDMSDQERDQLQSWPIWNLTKRTNASNASPSV
jgi:hypothetical protein